MFEKAVREFIMSNFLYGQERTLNDSDSFLAEGIVDSTGVLQLVAFLEETYGITVEDEEITPENFDSIRSLTSYIARKTNMDAESECVGQAAEGTL
jgi:acyl carrier protein